MPWLQLHIPADRAGVEKLQTALETLGAGAVTVSDAADQPVLEPAPGETPLWDSAVVTALFEAGRDRDALIAELTGVLGRPPAGYRFEELADQDWERSWMDDFHPLRFGERLWIVPSWQQAPDPDAVNIRLDPGLAFGTGTHETTALCLEWLDRAELAGKRLVDYGCGSGILAIAALLLGAERVAGCDLDPQALDASKANAEANGVSARLDLSRPGDMADDPVDIIVANILAGPLLELAPELAARTRPGGQLVLSGILADQAEDVAATYRHWFDMDTPAIRGDWVRLTGRRRQSPHT